MKNPAIWALVLGLFAQASATAAAPRNSENPEAAAQDFFKRLDGSWTCAGAFADGKALAADLAFRVSPDGRALRYRHTDRPPSTYVQEALWGYDGPAGAIVSSAIVTVDPSQPTSTALYVATEWTNSSIQLVARPMLTDPWAPNRFTYRLEGADQLRMVWELMRDGEWRMGDYLDCKRPAPR